MAQVLGVDLQQPPWLLICRPPEHDAIQTFCLSERLLDAGKPAVEYDLEIGMCSLETMHQRVLDFTSRPAVRRDSIICTLAKMAAAAAATAPATCANCTRVASFIHLEPFALPAALFGAGGVGGLASAV